MKKYAGEEFLNKIYKDLVNSEIVKHTSKGGNKNEDVHTYMERLERITKRGIEHDKLRILKQAYYNKYVIKPENVPESYFKQQEHIALDRGYGHVHYTEEIKKKEIEQIIREQKSSLDSWIDYFASSDTEMYPTWFKYFCFQGMVRLGYFDKKEDKYTKRTESTVKPFIEINREALAMLYDELIKVLNKEEIDDKKLEELLKSGSFSKIYAYCIKKLDSVKKDKTNSDEGIWKKYPQGSDANILFNDIHGKGTGWCTAGGLETATTHLEGGDFYVYFTKDEKENFTYPRIAIRMYNGKIAEIRGIAEQQNIESNMEKVVEKKLEEFPDKELYKKKVKDMEMLTHIYSKWKNNADLTKNDLIFIYEIESKITGFGYRKDPRISEITSSRNIKKDLSLIFNCSENQISLTPEEALSGNVLVHYGDLNLSHLFKEKILKLPKTILGNVDLSLLHIVELLELPKVVHGKVNLENLRETNKIIFPDILKGGLYLGKLSKIKELILPRILEGETDLSSLVSVEKIVFPEEINEDVYLDCFDCSTKLEFPSVVDGSIYLRGIQSIYDIKLPDILNGTLCLDHLIAVNMDKFFGTENDSTYENRRLKLPYKIAGTLDMGKLRSVEDLEIPDELECELYCPIANNDINVLKQMCKENNKAK